MKRMKGALVLNLTFAIIEVIGGLYFNSVAILSDALHDFGDSAALGANLLGKSFSARVQLEVYVWLSALFSFGRCCHRFYLVAGISFHLN